MAKFQVFLPGGSTPRITQQLERQFTSGSMSVKDKEESFCTHQSACELSLCSLRYRSSKIDTTDRHYRASYPSHAILAVMFASVPALKF